MTTPLRRGRPRGIVIPHDLAPIHLKPTMMTDLDQLTIRRALSADAPVVAELARRTFMDAFGDDSDPHDVVLHVARSYGVPQQSAEIAHPGITTLVAEVAGHPAAYTQIRRGQPPSCVPDGDAVEIARFYVDQAWHGRGIAQRLMNAALAEARGTGARMVWLMVYEHNHRALAFYAREGFRETGRHGFLFGNSLVMDLVLVRGLDEDVPEASDTRRARQMSAPAEAAPADKRINPIATLHRQRAVRLRERMNSPLELHKVRLRVVGQFGQMGAETGHGQADVPHTNPLTLGVYPKTFILLECRNHDGSHVEREG